MIGTRPESRARLERPNGMLRSPCYGVFAAGFGAVTAAVGVIATPAVAAVVGPLLAAAAPVVTDSLNELLDLRDDNLGQQTLTLTAKWYLPFS